MPLEILNNTVANIVRQDYRTADVFKKYGLNYCCGGNIPLKDYCEQGAIDYNQVVEALEVATKDISVPNSLNFAGWKTDFLIDYVINVHHAYLYQVLPSLEAQVISFVHTHQKQFPELRELPEIFSELSAVLKTHNLYEEEIIFPYIKQIENTHRRKESYGNLFVKTLRKPLGNIEADHKKIAAILQELRQLTGNYIYPDNACTNQRVVFLKFRELDNDLTQHKHLENNILFPRAMQLEKDLLQLKP